MIGKFLVKCSLAAVVMQFFVSNAHAVDTMADWIGFNNRPTDPPSAFAPDNDYGLISPTSVGGQIQSKVNFAGQFPTELGQTINTEFVYFSDPSLNVATPLNFTSTLHMEGAITINSPQATEPNLLFGWYNSEDSRHRIGFGISNLSTGQGGAVADRLRVDFGYAAEGGNRFYFVSDDGTADQTNNNSLVPNGTYSFTFDYVPAATGVGGTMSATVGVAGQYFRTVVPLETQPWDLDVFDFDRFGLLQRSTSNTTQLGNYNIVFSNVSYTGGTAAAVAIPGDFDADADVDGADLAIWKANYGTGTSVATGDADGDNDADGNDFLVWQRNLTSSPVFAIPEPSAFLLLSMGGIAILTRRLRRRE